MEGAGCEDGWVQACCLCDALEDGGALAWGQMVMWTFEFEDDVRVMGPASNGGGVYPVFPCSHRAEVLVSTLKEVDGVALAVEIVLVAYNQHDEGLSVLNVLDADLVEVWQDCCRDLECAQHTEECQEFRPSLLERGVMTPLLEEVGEA